MRLEQLVWRQEVGQLSEQLEEEFLRRWNATLCWWLRSRMRLVNCRRVAAVRAIDFGKSD